MRTIVVAIHGILTSQTTASWPDKLDAWMFARDPAVRVLKKEYAAGPFPRFNCWIKDPILAHSLANELELFLHHSTTPSLHHSAPPPLWFVAHSNGAVIALLTASRLIAHGHHIAGLILIGAAIEPDITKNHILAWLHSQPSTSCPANAAINPQPSLGAAIAYSSHDDAVLPSDCSQLRTSHFGLRTFRAWLWRKLTWPYGSLGRTGWLCSGRPIAAPSLHHSTTPPLRSLLTRWFPGGHTTYFAPGHIQSTFTQIHHDIRTPESA